MRFKLAGAIVAGLLLTAASAAPADAASNTITVGPATTPATGTGAFVPAAPPVTISSRSADGNTFITQVLVLNDTGVLAGTDIDTINYVFHPDGTITFTAITAFTGMVAGRSGTIAFHFEGTGNAVSFQGQIQTLSGTGTGALATLHGQGPFQGSTTTGVGTYVFQYHFGP